MKAVINKSKNIFMFFLLIILIFIISFHVTASNKLSGIQNFPESYQGYLLELSKKHPNWTFTALYTNLDWNYVVSQENIFGKNLVPKNYSDAWKNTNSSVYNVEVDSGWVDSSKQAVEFCLDPRNFLNEVRIFQFEELSYNSNSNNLNGIEKILYGTEFYNRQVSYLDSYGNTISMTEKYSDLILRAGQTSYVNPYHLASRIKQEVGPFLTHNSISGTVEGFEGLYNFYNIGATSSLEPMGAIKNGLQYAKDGKGASIETRNKYLIPWNNKEKAITGGGIFIGSSYINVGQNSIYLQKFDVNDVRSQYLFSHQYMTNVLAPYTEAKSIYNGYYKSGLINTSMSFIIPVYENMPEIPTQNPNIIVTDFQDDNTKVYCNATNVNIRTGPAISYEIITTIPYEYKMTRIGIGVQSGDKWDRVILENGIVGYIYQNYVNEEPEQINYKKVTDIEINPTEIYLSVGDTAQLIGNVIPDDANEKKILYKSTDTEIVTVTENGVITACNEGEASILAIAKEDENIWSECKVIVIRKLEFSEIEFDNSLKVNNLEITGIDYTKNTVLDIKQKITTDLEIEIVNNKNQVLSDTDLVGTGSKILIKENGIVLKEFTIILYGDINGDGKINSIDLLILQRHILEIERLEQIYTKAGNINKNGKKPTSLDLLLIQRHILGLKRIEQ